MVEVFIRRAIRRSGFGLNESSWQKIYFVKHTKHISSFFLIETLPIEP